jgi:hypothetical protein
MLGSAGTARKYQSAIEAVAVIGVITMLLTKFSDYAKRNDAEPPDFVGDDGARRRMAYHESGHAISAVAWGVPIRRVSIEPPEMRHSLWFNTSDNTRLQRLAAMRLAGSAAERFFVGPVEDDSVDLEMARGYLAAVGLDPSQIEAELTALRSEAERLVRTSWAQKRIRLVADALLRDGRLDGEAVKALCRRTITAGLHRAPRRTP